MFSTQSEIMCESIVLRSIEEKLKYLENVS